jgi:hypothetical protein
MALAMLVAMSSARSRLAAARGMRMIVRVRGIEATTPLKFSEQVGFFLHVAACYNGGLGAGRILPKVF